MPGPIAALVWVGGVWVLKEVAGGVFYDVVYQPGKDAVMDALTPDEPGPRPPTVYADGHTWLLRDDGNYEYEEGHEII